MDFPFASVTHLSRRPAGVIILKGWKEEMVKEPEAKQADPMAENLTGQEMTMKLVELITENRYEEAKIREVLAHAVKVFSRRRERE